MSYHASNEKLIMEVCIEVKIKLKYIAIYEKGTNRLLYYSRFVLIFDGDINMRRYVASIEATIKEKYQVPIITTLLHGEHPIEFIRTSDGGKAYINKTNTEDC